MMEEVIDITPDMMHKFYNNLDNSNRTNNRTHNRTDENDDRYSITEKYSNTSHQTKMLLLLLFVFAVILYILSILSNNITNDNYYQKLH
jgi:hypothetical protein